jgi:hypothetical protein
MDIRNSGELIAVRQRRLEKPAQEYKSDSRICEAVTVLPICTTEKKLYDSCS